MVLVSSRNQCNRIASSHLTSSMDLVSSRNQCNRIVSPDLSSSMDPVSSKYQCNRIISSGKRPMVADNVVEQIPPEDEKIVSSSIAHSPDPATNFNVIQTPTNFYPYDWDVAHPGYAQSITPWDGYLRYAMPEGMHVPQVFYNDNSSLMYQTGFSYNPYPYIMLEGQIPTSLAYYPQFSAPSAMHFTPSEICGDNSHFDPTSAYMIPFGQYGGGNLPANQGDDSLTSSMPYPQTMGILGPYDHNASQGSGIASSSSLGGHYHVGSYQSPNYVTSYYGADKRVRLTPDVGNRREKEHGSVSNINHLYGNRGPRSSSRRKTKNTSIVCSTNDDSMGDPSKAEPNLSLYNHPEFVTDYKNAKFFILKSFSEDNVHKSIKYNVWASTPHGNTKLDIAYRDAAKLGGNCPIFLFFSVNASGQFCGVAEMVGPVDFENDAAYWQQDKWSGQFPVKWHIVKDVPNTWFCNMLLQNNDNKPVTHSRDSQEVNLRQGIEMLKIFKKYEAHTSILDDFCYYDEKERRKVGEDGTKKKDAETETSVEQISERLQGVTVEDEKEEEKEKNCD